VESTIDESRKNNNCCIIIDKISKKCFVYLSGLRKYEFEAELGRNWIGTKRIMGDKATPEGLYKIVKKYEGNETPYHKSLGLDYPNNEDQRRFKKEVANGTLPKSSKIGSGIEIHGEGGKGVDWTDGCIALLNSEIDILYNLVTVGTPVTIVGSARSLNEIIPK
jgi:murein L,D-transpeptidase YafK